MLILLDVKFNIGVKMYFSDSLSSNYNIIIGIDWADQKHDLAIFSNGEMETKEIENNPKVLHRFFLDLCEKNKWQKIAVIIEKNSNMIMHILSSIALVDVYAVHPNTAASYRDTFKPSGVKTDEIDALSLLDLFLKHPEKIRRYQTRQKTDILDLYCQKRRCAVDDRKSIGNQLTASLKKSYPVIIDIFKGSPVYAPILLNFLKKWPDAKSVKEAGPGTVKNYFARKSSKMSKTSQRLKQIKESENFLDEQMREFYRMEIECLVLRLEKLNDIINKYDKKIAELYKENEDYNIFNSFHGAGEALGPRIMAFFGNDRDKFLSADEAAIRAEIAPVKIQSGKSEVIRRRYLCNKFLQQTFVEFANGSLKKSLWAKAYYQTAKTRGKGHNEILRALAFKWIRIIYACWKNHQIYDEQKHIMQMTKRRSPIVHNLQKAC